jgi:peptidoglycan hydrolase-like protein with peptidoglycan-binding domain
MHLDEIADIESGDVLDAGELIGFVGDTGNANGVSHLHFEVRSDRRAIDPYPRIEKEYTLEEKMEILSDILDDVRDEDELAKFLVEAFSGVFLLAQGTNIELHEAIEDALEDIGFTASIDGVTRDLRLGSEGNDVVKVQSFLIALNTGPAAVKLANSGATGYFGPVTEAALIEYQRAVGITPANGQFGPVTRTRMQSGGRTGVAINTTSGGGVIEPKPVTLGLIATLIPHDIAIGAEGVEVRIIQLFLILKQTGPAARALFAAGATGYFGPITSAALSEYQNANGILRSGVYDASTRAHIKSNE